MILIVAEKKSVADAIAAVVGTEDKQDGYYSGGNYLVSWCVGHLVELAKPAAYGVNEWRLENLPIIPTTYLTAVSSKKKEQFEILKSLMERPDVTELIEATDAGREGELIFRLVYHQAHCRKPFCRLWVSSLEEKSIREGLDTMKPGSAYDALYHAAICRQRADWLVGINFTRLYTVMYGKTLTCGRVQTPTVNLIVRRQREIEDFRPTPYYVLSADCGGLKLRHREDDKAAAERLKELCAGKRAVITKISREDKAEKPAPLYDLTTLQREANRYLGYSAQQTLDYAQRLYESKLATYPRTDSKYVTHDQADTVRKLVEMLKVSGMFSAEDLSSYSMELVDVGAVINDKKVSDHHALLPTEQITPEALAELPTGERNILLLICYRLMAAVYAPYQFQAVKVEAELAGETFTTSGRKEIAAGYQIITRQLRSALGLQKEPKAGAEDLPNIPNSEGDTLAVDSVVLEERKTEPPAAYTEDTLLSAMETAGRSIEDPELREAMKDKGLGTPATRAPIIENIIKGGYIVRDGKKLLPTDIAYKFIDIAAPMLKEPEMTASWEQKLAEIQRGEGDPAAFMGEITSFCKEQISHERTVYTPAGRNLFCSPVGKCPFCGKNVVEMPKSYSCENRKDCGLVIWKVIAGKQITRKHIDSLLSKGRTDLINGLKSNAGKTFAAYLVLRQEDHKIGFEFPPKKDNKRRK